MAKFSFAVPVLPGKDAHSIPAYCRKNMKAFEASRKRAGVTMERVYLMPTPMGSFATAYIEAAGDFAATFGSFFKGDAFDKGFLNLVAEVHGFDISAPPSGPPPETIADWRDPAVKERRKGLAFVSPTKPGTDAAGRAFAKEAFEKRRAEFADSRRAKGLNGESVFLNQTPNGTMICVYIEGNDPAAGNRAFAESKSPYDVWFKGECRKIFIDGVDFNQPVPPIETLWDWVAA